MRRDITITAHCLELVESLAETWRAAALQSSAAVGA